MLEIANTRYSQQQYPASLVKQHSGCAAKTLPEK